MKLTNKEKCLAEYFRDGIYFGFDFTSKDVSAVLKKVKGTYFVSRWGDDVFAFSPDGDVMAFCLGGPWFTLERKFVFRCARLYAKGYEHNAYQLYDFIKKYKFDESRLESLLIKELGGIATSYDKKLLTRWRNLNKK
ncbi:MAG: hypothetical protein WC523_04795 [Patescibacteria group bacterium]